MALVSLSPGTLISCPVTNPEKIRIDCSEMDSLPVVLTPPSMYFFLSSTTGPVIFIFGIVSVTAVFEGVNRHPGNLPDCGKQIVKLVVAQYSGVIIGGEVIGGLEAGELTNVIGFAIQNRMTVNSLLSMQIGTHPCLTASPAAYPLIKAAEMIAIKLVKSK